DTILRVPARARGHRAPLILALHFAGGTGAQMEQATRYTPQAARSGFVVAYPTASGNPFWSFGGAEREPLLVERRRPRQAGEDARRGRAGRVHRPVARLRVGDLERRFHGDRP